MASITLDRVRRSVGGNLVLDGLSLDVADGEFVVLIGPSGAGKTAILRAIAGLDRPDAGRVWIGGVDVTRRPPPERDVSMVFQEGALIPRFTAEGNVGYPLRLRKMDRTEIERRVSAEARALDVEHVLDRWPRELAAGHAQLVELARAMVRVPSVLLLDEPMSRLDPPIRHRLRVELRTMQLGYGVTTILASNDSSEAMALADRVVAIDRGAVAQIGSPLQVYAEPRDLGIAILTGDMGVIDAETRGAAGGGVDLIAPGLRLRCRAPSVVARTGRRIRIGLRPEHVVIDQGSTIRAEVVGSVYDAGRPHRRVRVGGVAITASFADGAVGDVLPVRIDRFLVFDVPSGELLAAVGKP